MVEIKNRKRKYDALSMNKGIKTIEDLIGIIEDYDTTFYEFKKLFHTLNEIFFINEKHLNIYINLFLHIYIYTHNLNPVVL